jgi:hypothetical protein
LVAQVLNNFAELYAKTGDNEQRQRLADRAAKIPDSRRGHLCMEEAMTTRVK